MNSKISVHVFDGATVGNTRLACTRVEKSKFACDRVVLTKSNGKYWAGRVNPFLSHAPPGWEDCHLSEEADVAKVDWFADAVPAAGISDGLSVCLGCPVTKRDFQDDRTGNFLVNGEFDVLQASFFASQLSLRQPSCAQPLCFFHASGS